MGFVQGFPRATPPKFNPGSFFFIKYADIAGI